jgi:hypothetical protein
VQRYIGLLGKTCHGGEELLTRAGTRTLGEPDHWEPQSYAEVVQWAVRGSERVRKTFSGENTCETST